MSLNYGAIPPRLDRFTVDATGCWIWQGPLNYKGYGAVHNPEAGNIRGAHREMYLALIGPIPDGLVIDHLCRGRALCQSRPHGAGHHPGKPTPGRHG